MGLIFRAVSFSSEDLCFIYRLTKPKGNFALKHFLLVLASREKQPSLFLGTQLFCPLKIKPLSTHWVQDHLIQIVTCEILKRCNGDFVKPMIRNGRILGLATNYGQKRMRSFSNPLSAPSKPQGCVAHPLSLQKPE